MTTIAVIALTVGLAALTAVAVFVYFGAYWRMVWRQNRDEERTSP
jgi:FlaG/FlaF family flagellin (archaellin)